MSDGEIREQAALTGRDARTFFRRQLVLVAGSMFLFTALGILGFIFWRTGLDEADKLSSVISMFTGVVGLGITVVTATRLTARRRVESDEQYWMLEGLREKIDDDDGGGLFALAGLIELPAARNFEWQHWTSLRSFLDEDWTTFADQLKSLAGTVQLSVLQDLVRSESGVLTFPPELSEADTKRRAAARRLAAAGWLEVRPKDTYRIPGDRFVPLLVILLAASDGA
jgi:hypothetical protein